MDGRRHSVDIPISRTLVALRRVKSLRDPTTNSMGKLSAFVENLNWETNSIFNNGNSLGLQENENDPGDYSVRKPSSRLFSHESPYWGVGKGGGYDDEGGVDVNGFDSGSNGCGISSCWLVTPRLGGSHTIRDTQHQQQPLLSSLEHSSLETTHYSYQRKFRPKSFNDLVGQSAVATSLSNTITNGRIHPLYLFHGPRGTGKTCAARIFAATLNCLCVSPGEDEEKPCGHCLECVLFFSGRGTDVKEVDCLKINKAERIKQLMKSGAIPPLSSRFKIFIFDECQLLEEETWGVILNGLDEILKHRVIFIMVTPDADKLPRAVVSRSQKYHFPKIKEVEIANCLGKICEEEGLEFEHDALGFIARKSNGSLRDGEIMLEQLSLLGKRITTPLVYELTGVVSDDELMKLLHLALSSDTCRTVKLARELMRSRIDPMQLISQLANLIMDILAGKRAIEGRFSEVGTVQLSHALKILSEAEKQLRTSKSQSTWLTASLLQLSSIGSSVDASEARLCSRTVYPQDGNCCSSTSSSTGESLKQLANYGHEEETGSCQVRLQDDKETLSSIWSRAIAKCESNALKSFLQRRGSLSSIFLKQGLAIAELKFCHPDHVSTAEKSWKLIAHALQQTLCCNVEIRINLVSGDFSQNRSLAKKLSFGLFGCSRREHHRPEFSHDLGSNRSDISNFASTKVGEKCPSRLISQTSLSCEQPKATVRTIRDNDGNALTLGKINNKDWTGLDILALDQQEKDHHGCFPRSVKHLKRSFSSNDSRMIRRLGPPSRNWALAIPSDKSSENPFYASDPRISCSQQSNCYPGNKDISRSSKFHCLRTVISPFRKALGLKRQPENAHLQLVMPCAPAQ
ncbi:unnamed protein product [Cuscuta epithymum]|uniref:AAA+ ATPase domain-containing protein n=1 Tax=Cuscuta epithymum TaxID=186058 RepID=A0AAV0GL14_9ASTE|nr:unnamed protein product [Cuscuta epithymum]